MKKLIALTAISAFAAAPAFAETLTIEFANTNGEVTTAVMDTEANTMTVNGDATTYSFDEATNTLCDTGDSDLCVTFEGEAQEMAPGVSGNYTATNGNSGVATVISVE